MNQFLLSHLLGEPVLQLLLYLSLHLWRDRPRLLVHLFGRAPTSLTMAMVPTQGVVMIRGMEKGNVGDQEDYQDRQEHC